MNVQQVIKELKDAGYTVRIAHERATVGSVWEALEERKEGRKLAQPSVYPKFIIDEKEWSLAHQGGRTIVRIFKGGELVTSGEAVCSPLDRFCKRTGLVKALGRALGSLSRG